MPIDRPTLLADTKGYLPDSNILSDPQITVINENVISVVGDEEDYYSEVLCKSLQAAARMNQALDPSSGSGSIKREKSWQREIEFYDTVSTKDEWEVYLKNLPNVCPYLPGGGYKGLKSALVGAYASVSDPVKVPNLDHLGVSYDKTSGYN